jgi:hypothetical protein
MTELAYPVGHPAHPDYKGEPYTPPGSPAYEDFRPEHPAYHGANVSELDTPDGMRAHQLKQENRLQDLAKSGSLPPLYDGVHKEPVPLAPEQLAHFYAARHAYDPTKGPSDDARQAVAYLSSLGYSRDKAVEMFQKYAQPEASAEAPKG